jgi:hypothetical protein
MKRLLFAILLTTLLIVPGQSFGYVTYLELDDTLDLSILHGIGFNVAGADFSELDLVVYYQGGSPVYIEGREVPRAVPDMGAGLPWDIQISDDGTVLATDQESGKYPLRQGMFLSLERSGGDAFTLEDFILYSDDSPDGLYPHPYQIAVEVLAMTSGEEVAIYRPVPIPSALFLLGGGLLGVMGVRVRRRPTK